MFLCRRAGFGGAGYGFLSDNGSTSWHSGSAVLFFLEQQTLVAHAHPYYAGLVCRGADPGPEFCDRAVYLHVLLRENARWCFISSGYIGGPSWPSSLLL